MQLTIYVPNEYSLLPDGVITDVEESEEDDGDDEDSDDHSELWEDVSDSVDSETA